MNAEYFSRYVYGKPVLYPANDVARNIVAIANQRSITPTVMSLAAQIGITWLRVADPTT